ncbi:hypothetical protein GGR58DRAFT_174334 [Xylaria digitata]|nr:hypothetical protein GGR58DRAFT_174334 [Xylaria digitata]
MALYRDFISYQYMYYVVCPLINSPGWYITHVLLPLLFITRHPSNNSRNHTDLSEARRPAKPGSQYTMVRPVIHYRRLPLNQSRHNISLKKSMDTSCSSIGNIVTRNFADISKVTLSLCHRKPWKLFSWDGLIVYFSELQSNARILLVTLRARFLRRNYFRDMGLIDWLIKYPFGHWVARLVPNKPPRKQPAMP